MHLNTAKKPGGVEALAGERSVNMTFRILITKAFFSVITLGLFVSPAFAARAVNYVGTVTVNVAVLNATEVVFPEEIASVVMGIANEKVSLEHEKNILFIQPLAADLEGSIFVIGRSGKSYELSVVVVDKTTRDRQLKITTTEEIEKERVQELKALTPLGLMRSMVSGQEIDGVFLDSKELVIYEDTGLRLTAERSYDAVGMKGYVIKIENLGQIPFDFRTLSMKGLVAFSYHKGKGYLVFYV